MITDYYAYDITSNNTILTYIVGSFTSILVREETTTGEDIPNMHIGTTYHLNTLCTNEEPYPYKNKQDAIDAISQKLSNVDSEIVINEVSETSILGTNTTSVLKPVITINTTKYPMVTFHQTYEDVVVPKKCSDTVSESYDIKFLVIDMTSANKSIIAIRSTYDDAINVVSKDSTQVVNVTFDELKTLALEPGKYILVNGTDIVSTEIVHNTYSNYMTLGLTSYVVPEFKKLGEYAIVELKSICDKN